MPEVGPELLGRIYDQQAAALVLYARQWCNTPEDVVQEALLRLAGQRTVPERLLPWLYRVVRNGALSAARAAGRRKKHESAAVAEREWFAADPVAALDGQSAVIALESLSIDDREIVVARLWGGLTFAEIAELIDATDSTAQRRYEAGLNKLRERLGVPCPNAKNPSQT